MAKILKILGNSFLILMEIVLVLIIALAFFIRTSEFQTYLAQKGAAYVSNKLQTKVFIGKVDIAFFDRIYFDNLYIEDQHKDTLGYIHEFYVNYSLEGIEQLNFNVDKVGIDKAVFHLKKYKNEEHLNLQFIIDAFKNEDTTKKVDFNINITRLALTNSHFTFQDENKELKPSGIDFSNLDTRKIKVLANNVKIEPRRYQADIKTISLKEKSGFELDKLQGKAVFSDKGLDLKAASIKTHLSDIHLSSFKLVSSSLSDFSSFVHAVKLESHFTPSLVSLKDVAYFAPQLKGMDETVELTGSSHDVVAQLSLNDIDLQFGKVSRIQGDFYLPDFKQLNKENIHQNLDYFLLNVDDLTNLKLPDSASNTYIKWPKSLVNIKTIEGYNLSINGALHDLNVRLDRLNSNVGNFVFNDEYRVKSDTSFSTLTILPKRGIRKQIRINQFAVNQIINNKNIDRINGNIAFNSIKFDRNGLKAKNINGTLNNSTLYSHTYDYIILDHLDYTLNNQNNIPQNQAEGNIYVRDENFDLTFKGFISHGNYLEMQAKIDVECAMLAELNPIFEGRGELITSMDINAKGKSFNDFKGNFLIDTLFYQEGADVFHTSNFYSFVERNAKSDSIAINSEVVDANVYGRIDYRKIGKNVKMLLAETFPAFNIEKGERVEDGITNFKYSITVNEVNDLLTILYPSVKISENTYLQGYYDGESNNLSLSLSSDYIEYQSFRFNTIYSNQEISNQELMSIINIASVVIYDSLTYTDIHFTGLAFNGGLDSQLLFDDPSGVRSNLQWYTDMQKKNSFDFKFYPSYIALNGGQWKINEKAHLNYTEGIFVIDSLKLEHENQYISADGTLSKSMEDRLYLDLMDLNLDEFSVLLGPDMHLSGVVNASGYATTPLSNLRFFGQATLKDLYVNETEVGDVGFGANFESETDKVDMFGDIFYRNNRTFHFEGFYDLREEEKKNNLNFDMQFKQTDIAVVNEFLDPEVIKNLRGKVNGSLQLRGTIKEPLLTGEVDVDGGMLNLAILGANMYFNGKIRSVKDGIYIDQMPLKDEEGNTGFITGSLFHNNFKDFYFEVVVNLEEDPVKRMPGDRSKPLPLDRFLVMNTTYVIDKAYYGTAYVTGRAAISGYADNLSIVVNATTKKGTKIFFPLYGPTTIEDEGYITFKKSGNEDKKQEPKIDLTGVDLQLNFDVTDDAEVKLIFDEKVGDELTSRGEGKLRLAVDKFNEIEMDGTYTVSDGVYNFAIGPYTQKFNIASGGTVQWDGNPIEPNLNLVAFYKTNTNLSVVMPDVVGNQSSNNEDVYSYMTIVGNVNQPKISFDIVAPNASEAGKAVISRIRSNPSELNKQFFSLVISKSFMPLAGQKGGRGGNSGAFLDIASQQINNVLNSMADGYKMNVNLDNDDYTGQFSGQFGVSKSFLDDRLLVSGSLGVGTKSSKNGGQEDVPNQSTFIGDVKIEYLLNEKGTFRMNAFNKSNNDYLLQVEGRGHYTQGVGVSYKESFHTTRDFKLLQFFANMFRKRENWVQLQDPNERKIPIPKKYYNKGSAVKEEKP